MDFKIPHSFGASTIAGLQVLDRASTVLYTVHLPHGIAPRIHLVDQNNKVQVVIKPAMFHSNDAKIFNAEGKPMGQFTAFEGFCEATGEKFVYRKDVDQNKFSFEREGKGIVLLPNHKLASQTTHVYVKTSHEDTLLMIGFSIMWLKRKIQMSSIFFPNFRAAPIHFLLTGRFRRVDFEWSE